ncbi:MAG: preprotein translocase subunit SecE [Planctomycetota bacterium]
MAGAIYKPGQGYWVRVMTAVGAGVLVLATAAWAASQAGLITPPVAGYDVAVAGVEGTVAEGAQVELYERSATGLERIGSGTVVSADLSAATPTVRVGDTQMEDERFEGDTERLRTADGSFSASVAAQPRTAYTFSRVYLQGGAAGLVLLLGAAFIYWHIALRKPSVEFLINTDNEMKKVNWSTRREVIGSTWVVVAASLLIAAALFLIDLMFQQVFSLMGVLETG